MSIKNKFVEADKYFVYGYNQKALYIMENISNNDNSLADVMAFDKLIKDLRILVKSNNKVNKADFYNDFKNVATYLGINKKALSQRLNKN